MIRPADPKEFGVTSHETETAGGAFDELEGDCGGADDGQVLICLRAIPWRDADAARKILQAMGATNITLSGEKASRLIARSFNQFDAGPVLSAA